MSFYNTVKCWFFPRQKWLTREIPNTWCDKVELIPCLLFACLVDFVEGENGLSQLDDDWTDDIKAGHISQEQVDANVKLYTLLKDAYLYIRINRPEYQKQLEDAYPKGLPTFLGGPVDHTTYAVKYAEVIRLEKLIEDRDQWAMKVIVENVGILWT